MYYYNVIITVFYQTCCFVSIFCTSGYVREQWTQVLKENVTAVSRISPKKSLSQTPVLQRPGSTGNALKSDSDPQQKVQDVLQVLFGLKMQHVYLLKTSIIVYICMTSGILYSK